MATPTPEQNQPAPQSAAGLLPALFEFAATPGRFSIALREPRVAFDNIQSVLMLACGRKVEAVPIGNAAEADVRRVARYFVRTAMLRPGADYYTLMGVQPGFAENTLREHYRLLMRLSHPDFATPGQAWPGDAATRINQANDVLSSAVRRHEYDTTVAPAYVARPQPPMGAGAPGMTMRRVPAGWSEPRASLPARLAAALASLAGGAAGAVGRIPLHKFKGGISFPRLGSSSATIAVACVAAAAGGSALTVWWMQGDRQDGGTLAATSPGELPVGKLDGTEYGPVLRSTAELYLPVELVGKPVERSPVIEAVRAEVVAAAPAAQLPPQPVAQQPEPVPAPSSIRAAPAAMGRDETAFRFSFTPPGSRPADVPARQAPPMQVTRPQAAVLAQQSQPVQSASPEPAVSARYAPPAAPVPAPEAPSAAAVAAATPSNAVPAPPPSQPAAAAPPRLMPKFSLADVQPTLANVIGAMQTGRAENVLQMVDASTRRADGGAAAFSEAYNRTVSGAKAVQLGKVSLSSVPLDDQLVVDGTVQLMVMDGNSVTTPKDLYIRAWFVARAGNPVLTRLSATPVRQ